MASQNSGLVLGVIVVVALWLISRIAAAWQPTGGWTNILLGIGFLLAVIGSVVFLVRMAKNIGKSD
jgi:hypothetical protein